MFIERVQINGFGCLQGDYEFSSGINLIISANESGKTTLADALTALLYGIKNNMSGRRTGDVSYKRYFPLKGEDFSISGIIRLIDGRRINIWRDFNKDTFRVLDLGSGKDISLDFVQPPNGDRLGESLTGLSFSQYRKLAVLSQDELNRKWDFVEFADQLSTVFSTDNLQGTTIEQAKSSLGEALSSFTGVTGKGKVKVDTEISRIDSRIIDLDSEISEINSIYEKVEHDFADAADKRILSDKIRSSIRKKEYFIALLRLRELYEERAEKKITKEKVRAIQYEIAQLQELKDCDYADIEQMAQLLALLGDKKKRLEDLDKQIRESQSEYAYLKVRADNLGQRENVSEELILKIEKNIDILENYQAREKSVLIDCRSAEAVLSESEVDSGEVLKFNSWAALKNKAEVALVKNYLQVEDKLSLAESELKQQRQKVIEKLESIAGDRGYRFKSARNNLILGCVFTAVSVGAFFAMGMLWFMLVPALICIGWAMWGAIALARVDSLYQREEVELQNSLILIDENYQKYEERKEAVERKFSSSADEMALSVDQLRELLVRFKKAESEISNWLYVYDRHRNISDVLNDCMDSLKKIFCEIGITAPETHLDVRRAKVLLREVSDALSVLELKQKMEEDISAVESAKEGLSAEIVDLEIELKDHFNAAGIMVREGEFNDAMIEFREKVEARDKLEHLENIELVKVMQELAEGVSLDKLNDEIEVWEKRRDILLEKDRWLESYIPDKDIFEYENEIKVGQLQLEDTQGELAAAEKVLAIEENRRKERLPQLLDQKDELLSARKKAEYFRKAVQLAADNLDRISVDLHARWSPLFSEEYNAEIHRFYSGLEFSLTKDLRLNAVIAESGQPLDNERLAGYMSKGARDQAYLVLRLLLARKVVENETFPVVLDDPFVNADDRRFVQGMEYLLEISQKMQVFVFSCHEIRHNDLCFENEAFADSVVNL